MLKCVLESWAQNHADEKTQLTLKKNKQIDDYKLLEMLLQVFINVKAVLNEKMCDIDTDKNFLKLGHSAMIRILHHCDICHMNKHLFNNF